MLSLFVVTSAALTLACFAWGLKRHFRSPDGTPAGMRALTVVSTLAALLFFVTVGRNGVEPGVALVFLLLSTLAVSLFWWAIRTTSRRPPHLAHSERDPDTLYEEGPYAYVRHPFYLSYALFWLGSAIVAGGAQWPAAAILVVWYYAAARREEAHFLRSSMAVAYTDYRHRTGMILPRL